MKNYGKYKEEYFKFMNAEKWQIELLIEILKAYLAIPSNK